MKPIHYFFACIIFFAGCTKDSDILYPDPFFPGQETFKAPLFIEVVNSEGLLISNAKITFGAFEGFTDAGGLLFIDEATVGSSAYLTVEKEGYFHASRRFYPAQGKAQFIKIMLLSDSRIAFFNTKDGAVLPLEDQASIHFPQDGYVLTNGHTYDGIVVVSAKSIPADDPDLSLKMPGDLVGVSTTGQLGALGSLGMITVEMKTPSGDKVEFKEGSEATLEMIIPPAMADKAPPSVPLWYFDTDEGVWREEGTAVRSGDRYIGKVNHFSTWNWDVWFESIYWGGTFVHEDGSPATQLKVCITIGSLGSTRCAYTDGDGTVRGIVAANEVLGLKVNGQCDQEIYSSEIGPYVNETAIGPVSISDPNTQCHVSGIAVDCDFKPMTNGFVKITTGKASYYFVPDAATGAFEGVVSSCQNGSINFLSFNMDDESFSKPRSLPFSPEVNVDTLLTCDGLNEYAVVYIEGFANPLYFDSLDMWNDQYTSISAYGSGDVRFGISFQGSSVGNYYAPDEPTIRGFIDSIQIRNAGPVLISIEKYGQIGEYITGRFQGKVNTSVHNFIPEYQMTGRFSVLRED